MILAAACAAAAVTAGPQPARAIVVPTPEPARSAPIVSATESPNATVLPFSSSLFFVLDDTISSRSKAGSVAHAHLRDPIVLNRMTIAPAGTRVDIVIAQTSAAQAGNVDGFVEMYFQALPIATGKTLPLTTPSAHLNPHMSAGQASTRGITDTVGDIFIPGHYLYHIFRKGSDVTLRPGTIIRARTAATLHVANGAVAISTPPPFATSLDTPHPAFVPAPLATPPGFHVPTPKPSPSVHPTTTP